MDNTNARIELIEGAIADSVEDFGDYELAKIDTDDAHWLIDKIRELQTKEENKVKFYEVHSPYYALLKAEDKENAKLEYNASVAGLEDINDINEVPEDYALLMFSRAPGEDKKLVEPNIILDDFRNPEVSILVLDGALL